MDEQTVEKAVAAFASQGLHAEILAEDPVILNVYSGPRDRGQTQEPDYLFTATLTVTP